jgi:hypothetical protein
MEKRKFLYVLVLSFFTEIILLYTLSFIGIILAILVVFFAIKLIMEQIEISTPNIWLYYNTLLIPLHITQEDLEKQDKEKQKRIIENEIKRILKIKGIITEVKSNIRNNGIEETLTYKTKKQTITLKLLYTQNIDKLLQEMSEENAS